MDSEQISQLRETAKKAAAKAYSPYSKVQVGAALLTENGTFSGCNIENASYGATICGERVALFKAVSEGATKLQAIYLYTKEGWPPCGMCRQVLNEFAGSELTIIIGDEAGKEDITTLSDLLPLAFRPGHLLK
ncbi:MAG: cytidine deaminase [Halobacteriovoraceae bacterium]|jgi:cytidine deaminase|nr:cytidine deaminase [Halobacteriovoraceae bacterium]